MNASFDARDVAGYGAELAMASLAMDATVGRLARFYGALMLTRTKANASGRPGPRVVTGDYRRTIGLEVSSAGPGLAAATVGTNADQGRRLELGFTGFDALGRYYDQPPFPHFGPALDATAAEAEEAAAENAIRILERGTSTRLRRGGP